MTCAFENITGYHLTEGDELMVLDTCGIPDPRSHRWPRDGALRLGVAQSEDFSFRHFTSNATSLKFTFGEEEVLTVPGGTYRLCWCRSQYLCDLQTDFRVDVGELLVIGPDHNQRA
jgi:hypothetical protein